MWICNDELKENCTFFLLLFWRGVYDTCTGDVCVISDVRQQHYVIGKKCTAVDKALERYSTTFILLWRAGRGPEESSKEDRCKRIHMNREMYIHRPLNWLCR